MSDIKHSSVVMSEALSLLSKLKKPDTGFERIGLLFSKLDEKVSETVLDQFVQDNKHLKELYIGGYDLPEADRPNVADLATKVIEGQKESSMEKLTLHGLSSKSADEPSMEEMQLINALVSSSLTEMNKLDLSGNPSLFLHEEASTNMFEFI